MNETNELLRRYVEDASEDAFQELVRRYINLVYSVALRRGTGDVFQARDIVQIVFTDLARKAHTLPAGVKLGGWLHGHCCFVTNTMKRSELRRQTRERQAMDLTVVHRSLQNQPVGVESKPATLRCFIHT